MSTCLPKLLFSKLVKSYGSCSLRSGGCSYHSPESRQDKFLQLRSAGVDSRTDNWPRKQQGLLFWLDKIIFEGAWKHKQATDYYDYHQREHVSLFFWMGYLLIKSPTEIKLWHFCVQKLVRWEMPVNCKPWICCKKVGVEFWSHGSGGTSEFMAKVQKNDVIFRQISGFNRVLSSPFPWENDPGCQIVFIWRLKPTNSDTLVYRFFKCLKFTYASASIIFLICDSWIYAFIVHYLHTHYVCFNMFTCVHVMYLYTYT